MEAIVVGTVRELDGEAPAYDLTVEIDEYLTGSGPDTITVRDQFLQGPACSPFSLDAVGKTYLLFLSRDEANHFRTTWCVGSGVIDDTNRDDMESIIEQIRLLVAGEPAQATEALPTTPADELPTAGGPAPATEALPTSVADELPQAGSGGDLPEQGNAWLFLAIAGAGLGVTGLGVLLRHGTHRR